MNIMNMIKKWNSGINSRTAGTIQVDFHVDGCFSGLPADLSDSRHGSLLLLFFKAHGNGICVGGELFCLRKGFNILVDGLQRIF